MSRQDVLFCFSLILKSEVIFFGVRGKEAMGALFSKNSNLRFNLLYDGIFAELVSEQLYLIGTSTFHNKKSSDLLGTSIPKIKRPILRQCGLRNIIDLCLRHCHLRHVHSSLSILQCAKSSSPALSLE